MPNGSVLVQTLSLDLAGDAGTPARKRIETRLLVRQQGEWTGYSYRWNAEQTDADLVTGAGDAAALDLLAAAHAASGDRARAADLAAQAVVLARREGREPLARAIEQRLAQYRAPQ